MARFRGERLLAGANEERKNELGGMEPGFANQITKGFRAAQTAHTVDGERHYPDCNAVAAALGAKMPNQGLDKGFRMGRISFI
jgi:hypothetical protein